MAVVKTGRKDSAEVRRACILRAARCVFARQGYAETVVDDIATQAGLAKGTLYLYFRSKEQIYLAALLEDARRMNLLTRERMAGADSWDKKVRAYMEVRLEYVETHQDFFRIYLTEIRSMMVRGARMECELYEVVRDSENQLAQLFAAAIARKEIRPVDPELAATAVSDLTRGLMERRLLGCPRTPGPADAQFTMDLLCRSLATPVS